MRTVLEVLHLSTDYLKQKGIQNSRRQAEELLGEVLGIGRMQLYLDFERPLSDQELERCREWLKRRGQGEPLSYIRGSVEFLGCCIKINRDVLIPRQETEILVSKVVEELSKRDLENKVLWDICCGSGCIGIALKKHFPKLQVSLSDISPAALAVAKENAEANSVNVECLHGDLLEPFKGRLADYIISNPPYVAEEEIATLEIEVRDYEPKIALSGGVSGLDFYRRLSKDLPKALKQGGMAWLEIGDGQGTALLEMFRDSPWKSAKVERDWSGRERFFSLEIE